VTSSKPPPVTTVPVRLLEDRFAAARTAYTLSTEAGFSRTTGLEVALAVSELAGNAALHGGGGELRLTLRRTPRLWIEVRASDRGPGLGGGGEDFSDGFSEGRRIGPDAPRMRGHGLGAGLGAVLRLMDEVRVVRGADGRCQILARRWTDR
jgi:serine/threonine-protein kinase RsbT